MDFVTPEADRVDQQPSEGGFVTPQADQVAADPSPGFTAPETDRKSYIDELVRDPSYNEFVAGNNPDEYQTAFDVYKARRARPWTQKAAGALATAVSPRTWWEGLKGVGKFVTGLGEAPLDAALQGLLSTQSDPRLQAKARTKQAEAILAAQNIERNLAETGGAIARTAKGIVGAGAGDEADFQDRVRDAWLRQQLAEGRPINVGPTAGLYQSQGLDPAEEAGPETLEAYGAPPVSQAAIERKAAAADPQNLILAKAGTFPGAGRVAGALTEGVGKTVKGVGAAISGASKAAELKSAPVLSALLTHNPVTGIKVWAGKYLTGKAGSAIGWLGDALEQQGGAARRGVAASALDEAQAAARAQGKAAPGILAKRTVGDAAQAGAATAVGMTPLHLAGYDKDPEKLAQSTVGAFTFGAALGAAQNRRAALTEAARPFLREQGAKAIDTNTPEGQASQAFLNSLPEAQRNSALEMMGAIGNLPTADGSGAHAPARMLVLDANTYNQMLAKTLAQTGQQGTPDSRGFFYGPDGTAFINGEHSSFANPIEATHTMGHEFMGHTALNILKAATSPGGPLYDRMMAAAKRYLFKPNGDPTPEMFDFINGYNAAAGHEVIRPDDPLAIEEFISEQAGQLMAGRGPGEIALPDNLSDKLTQGIGQFMAAFTGMDPRLVGTKTKYDRTEVAGMSKLVRDTLMQIAGMRLREGKATDPTSLGTQPPQPSSSPSSQPPMQPQGSPAAGTAPAASHPSVRRDAVMAMRQLGISSTEAQALIAQVERAQGAHTDPGVLVSEALKVRKGTPAPSPNAQPQQPTANPVPQSPTAPVTSPQPSAGAAPESGRVPPAASQRAATRGQLSAVLDQIGDAGEGLGRKVENIAGEPVTRVAGDYDPQNPLHQEIGRIAGLTPEGERNLVQAQQARGQVRHIRYRSAEQWSPGETGMTQRRAEYDADPASTRTEGNVQHKAVIPLETEVTANGKIVHKFFTLDNLLHNAAAVFDFLGDRAPYPKDWTQREPMLTKDLQDYADNHAHGYRGDGKPMRGFPDSGFPAPDPDFAPHEIPADRLDFINLLFGDQRSTASARGVRQGAEGRAKEKETRNLARLNDRWIDPATGEVNKLRAQMRNGYEVRINGKVVKKIPGFDFADKFKSPYEVLEPSHILEMGDQPLPLQPGDVPTIRPTGMDIPAGDLGAKGLPNERAVRAGFMPAERTTYQAPDRKEVSEFYDRLKRDGLDVDKVKRMHADMAKSPVFQTGRPDSHAGVDVRFQPAEKAGATEKTAARATKLWKEKGVESPFFKKWQGKAKLYRSRDDDFHDIEPGKPVVIEGLHGTTKDFTTVDVDKTNSDNDWGKGFYISNSPDDVAENYAGFGPDLTNRIERQSENIESRIQGLSKEEIVNELGVSDQIAELLSAEDPPYGSAEYKYKRAALESLAKKDLSDHAGATMKVFAKLENPFVFDPNGKPEYWDMEYPPEGDDYSEPTGKIVDFMDAIERHARYYDGDLDPSWRDELFDGSNASNAIVVARKALEGADLTDPETGDIASAGQIIRDALQDMGYDGIVDKSVDTKFGSNRRTGRPMEGVYPDTVHVIAFDGNQIKSATGNQGTFDKGNPDIRFMPDTPAFKRWFGESKVVDDDGDPIRLFHATRTPGFNEFEVRRKTVNSVEPFGNVETERHAIFATENPKFSEEFIGREPGSAVMPIYMKIEKPLDLRNGWKDEDLDALEKQGLSRRWMWLTDNHWELFDGEDGQVFTDAMKAAGYDGAIFYEDSKSGFATTYAALSPGQVKSATGNQGTFDKSNPDIRFMPHEEKDSKLIREAIRGARKSIAESRRFTDAVPLKLATDAQGVPKVRIVEDDNGKKQVIPQYETHPYDLRGAPGLPPVRKVGGVDVNEPRAVTKLADAIVKEVEDRWLNEPSVMEGNGWYSKMRAYFQKQLGANIEVFGQLLGATSARTDVPSNFQQSIEALRNYNRGDYDDLLQRYHDHVMAVKADAESGALFDRWKEANPNKRDSQFDVNAEYRKEVNAFSEIPLKANGTKFNMNSRKVLQALYGNWLEQTVGPKTPNFAGNLTGRTTDATIDVWAARYLRRLLYEGRKKQWRLLPKQETGVDFTQDKSGKYGGDFVFAQKAMAEAGKRLGIAPDDLQAILWFAEKQIWGERGYEGEAEKFSFEKEAHQLEGNRFQAGVTTAREDEPFSQQVFDQERAKLRKLIGSNEGLISGRVTSSHGLYGGVTEPSFDVEFTYKPDADPKPVVQHIIDVGRRHNQTDVFVSQVVDSTHPNARPGIEIGFKSPASDAEVSRVADTLRENGVDGFTIARDARGRAIGLRAQYIPEISGRYDESHLDPKQAFQHSAEWVDKARQAMTKIGRDNISYATESWFSTNVYGREEYATVKAQSPSAGRLEQELGRRRKALQGPADQGGIREYGAEAEVGSGEDRGAGPRGLSPPRQATDAALKIAAAPSRG